MINDYRIVRGEAKPGLASSFTSSERLRGQSSTDNSLDGPSVSDEVITDIWSDRSDNSVTISDQDATPSLQIGFGIDSQGHSVMVVSDHDASDVHRNEVHLPVDFANSDENQAFLAPDSISSAYYKGVRMVRVEEREDSIRIKVNDSPIGGYAIFDGRITALRGGGPRF